MTLRNCLLQWSDNDNVNDNDDPPIIIKSLHHITQQLIDCLNFVFDSSIITLFIVVPFIMA